MPRTLGSGVFPGECHLVEHFGFSKELTDMNKLILIALLMICPVLTSHAVAQTEPTQTAAPPTVEFAQQVVRRSRDVASCVERIATQYQQTMTLLTEADTRSRTHADPSVRSDARVAIVSLARRAEQLRVSLSACASTELTQTLEQSAAPTSPPAETEPNLDRQPPMTRRVSLSEDVGVARAEQVEGSGTVTERDLLSSLRAASAPMTQCYEQYLDRAARTRGTLSFNFTVDGGRVSGVALDSRHPFDANFGMCVSRLIGGLRVTGARGTAVVAVDLVFEHP